MICVAFSRVASLEFGNLGHVRAKGVRCKSQGQAKRCPWAVGPIGFKR